MASDTLFLLVGLPRPVLEALGEQHLNRLLGAHPRVRVEIVDSNDRFLHLVPQAHGAMMFPPFQPPPEILGQDGRLRWIQSMPAGVDWLLTPQLISAPHITITATKGPMGPLMAEHIVLLMLALARNEEDWIQAVASPRRSDLRVLLYWQLGESLWPAKLAYWIANHMPTAWLPWFVYDRELDIPVGWIERGTC